MDESIIWLGSATVILIVACYILEKFLLSTDPWFSCSVHTEKGCREINSPECNMSRCAILAKHKKDKENG